MGALTLFLVLGFLIVVCSVMVISSKSPVSSAVFLVLTLFLMAGVYAILGADFIAAIQVLLYAGAIMVLFLFVIMLINLNPDASPKLALNPVEIFVLLVVVVGFLIIAGQIGTSPQGGLTEPTLTREMIEQAGGHTTVVAMTLFTKYLWPFELASILILLAIVSSVVVAKRKPKEVG